MHTYQPRTNTATGLTDWVVTFSTDSGTFIVRVFTTEADAAGYVSFLNGGASPPPGQTLEPTPVVP